jgi:type I restriction enzyme, R subunit
LKRSPTFIGDNLFAALPHATRLAFTGTPLITERHKKKTWERFGGYIDKYRLQDAVDDGATVQILYEGKTADTALNEKHAFDTKFEDLFGERTDAEILAIKKKYGASGDIFEAERRIEAIANDMVCHYIENILPNGFKAQVVCNSKMAAIHYKTYIDKALTAELEMRKTEEESDEPLIQRIAFLKSAVVVSSDGTNEMAVVTKSRKHAKEVDAVENFKRPFNCDEPGKELTGLAFLIVCDMLLTGFDAPVEQVMYIDKIVKEHNLLQTIARVNRVQKGKSRGYIVDYVGLATHLQDSLSKYSGDDRDDVENSLKNIKTELPILESRFQRLIHLFTDNGVPKIEGFVRQTIACEQTNYEILEQAVEKLGDVRLRATFEVYMKKFLQSMDVVLPAAAAKQYKVPVGRFGYLLAKVKQRYKDDSLNISGAGAKVRKLINEHLISLGINPKIRPVELFSDNFIKELEKNQSPKAKASEMEHAIRKHCKVYFEEDPAFYAKLSEKLEALIQKHKEDWDQLCLSLTEVRDEAKKGREDEIEGVTATEAPFYDLTVKLAFGGNIPQELDDRVKQLMREVIEEFQKTIDIINFWNNGFEVEKLKGRLSDLMLFTNIDPIVENADRIVTEITALAKVRHRDIVK